MFTSRNTLETIPMITCFTLAAEGTWGIVTESIWVAAAELTFIYICKAKDQNKQLLTVHVR